MYEIIKYMGLGIPWRYYEYVNFRFLSDILAVGEETAVLGEVRPEDTTICVVCGYFSLSEVKFVK